MESDAQSPRALTPFGKYLLDEQIAEGGMARVYSARLVGLGGFEKRLVVKQVRPELARDPRFVTMFVDEAKTLVRMSHPHIVPVYELGVVDGTYFLAMEYVEGATLEAILAEGPLDAPLVAHVGMQIADALAYAHGQFALIHRDVTPRNIMVDARGHVRLLDFGIATGATEGAQDEVMGSIGYMAPEQATGGVVDARSDLFSLGAVLFEALSGDAPFLRKTIDASREALLSGPEPSLPPACEVPGELAHTVMRLLARQPDDRPANTADVAAELRSWLGRTHPAGVAAALGARADAATRRAHRPRSTPPPSGSATGRAEAKSLATSPALDAWLTSGASASTRAEPTASGPAPAGTVRIPGRGASASSGETENVQGASNARGESNRGSTSKRPAAAAALIAVIAVLGIAFAITRPGPEGARRAPSTRDAHAAATPQASTSAATEATHGNRMDPANAPEKGAPEEHASDENPTVGADTVATARTPGSTTPANTSPRAAGDTHPTRNGAPSSTAAGAGAALTLNAMPWARVRIDGRDVGVTPRRRTPVGPGTHTVEFECPPLGRSARTTVVTIEGQTTAVVADLTRTPPTITKTPTPQ
ncbi:MAG: protein kinase [Polyangiales bacterium]